MRFNMLSVIALSFAVPCLAHAQQDAVVKEAPVFFLLKPNVISPAVLYSDQIEMPAALMEVIEGLSRGNDQPEYANTLADLRSRDDGSGLKEYFKSKLQDDEAELLDKSFDLSFSPMMINHSACPHGLQLADVDDILQWSSTTATQKVRSLETGRVTMTFRKLSAKLLMVGCDSLVPFPTKGIDDEYRNAVLESYPEYSNKSCLESRSDQRENCSLHSVLLKDPDDLEAPLFCSGVAITDRHVLTAAHCVCEVDRPNTIEIVVGFSLNSPSIPVEMDATEIYQSPYAQGPCGASERDRDQPDLAILTLEGAGLASVRGDYPDEYQALIVPAAIADIDMDILIANAAIDVTDPRLQFMATGLGNVLSAARPILVDGMNTVQSVLWGKLTGEVGLIGKGKYFSAVAVRSDTVSLCRGDSGGGLFKPIPEDQIEKGYAAMALAGIISGRGRLNECPEIEDTVSEPARQITRLDTEPVRNWIIQKTACTGTCDWTGVKMDAATIGSEPFQSAQNK